MKELLQGTAGRLITTWPVVTETAPMLDVDARAQVDPCRWVAAGGVVVHEVPQAPMSEPAAEARVVEEQVEWALHITTDQFTGTKA